MTKLRKETRLFKRQALDSLVLAIEMFNRPHNNLRMEAVLIFLQHSFEMLLKGAIYEKRRNVYESKNITYRFSKCVSIAHDDLNILTGDTVTSLSILDGLRDCATHHHLQLSEDSLYLQAQAAVTTFDEILQKAFGDRLTHHLPDRVLPVSTNPPKELLLLLDGEFSTIRQLLAPGKRRKAEAEAMIRPFLIMESAIQGEPQQPSRREVSDAVKGMRAGGDWRLLFPGVASLRLDTTGNGLSYSVRFTREPNAAPVRILREGEVAEGTTLVREVNFFDRFSLGLFDVADKVGIGSAKTLALIKHLGLQEDPDCFKVIVRKSAKFKCYSPKAIERIKEARKTLDIEQVWQEYKQKRKVARSVSE